MKSLAYKIIASHAVGDVDWTVGAPVSLKIDQTLTQDATGTMAYLQFEQMGVPQVQTMAVSYIDHNMLQNGFMNADDHRYLQTVANRYGVKFSKAGNGICHQVHLERFAVPGQTLLGSDSHTPTCGGMGMLAMGAGGLDVACAMAGRPYTIALPEVVEVRLVGALQHGVSAKDIILEVLRRVSVKGGVGRIFEYTGPGLAGLSVPERSTITNMGAELGATTSLFPSDEVTLAYLKAQGRETAWFPLAADDGASYTRTLEIDLDTLVPLAAAPHSPDNVKPVAAFSDIKVSQVCIGSCTNSSFMDLSQVAAILRGRTVHPDVSLTLSFGSKQVLGMLAQSGALADLIASGARLLESACGPCIGMGQSPASGAVSLRTFNRNFEGRSGTPDAQVYLVSPETAAASALTGTLTSAEHLPFDKVGLPEHFAIDDSGILEPDMDPAKPIIKGPNIKDVPVGHKLGPIHGQVLITLGDNITTDHIAPAGAKVLPYRSNIEMISTFCFTGVDPDFPDRAKAHPGGIIVAGENYGQGSSREHAALAPLYLGVKAVIADSFARIHHQNLINSGIVPLIWREHFPDLAVLDELEIKDIEQLAPGSVHTVVHTATGRTAEVTHQLTDSQIRCLRAGGLLTAIKEGITL